MLHNVIYELIFNNLEKAGAEDNKAKTIDIVKYFERSITNTTSDCHENSKFTVEKN